MKAPNASLLRYLPRSNILRAGLILAEQVLANEQYQPLYAGDKFTLITPCPYHRGRYGATATASITCWRMILRTPSGVSYMLENRKMMMRLYPEMFEQHHITPVERYPSYLLQTLRESLAGGRSVRGGDDARTINSAYFEHSFWPSRWALSWWKARSVY